MTNDYKRFEMTAEEEERAAVLSQFNNNPFLTELMEQMESDCVDSLVAISMEDHMGRLAFTQRISILREMKVMFSHLDETYKAMLKRRHERE